MPSTRLQCALKLRDAALWVLREHGHWEQVSGLGHLAVSREGLQMSFRPRFQGPPISSEYANYLAARFGVRLNLPYGLDIWAPNKVMNLEWDRLGHVDLVSFRRGPWECQLLAMPDDSEGARPACIADEPL
jgi:hypothetical protein